MTMLTELCRELKNWFKVSEHRGTYTVTNGYLDLSDLVESGHLREGQFFRIQGSVFNDGVHQYPVRTLDDETFDGIISPMAIPKDFIELMTDIESWQQKYGNVDSPAMSPYSSESFGGYSYTKSQGYASAGGGVLNTWQAAFAARLNQWRKL